MVSTRSARALSPMRRIFEPGALAVHCNDVYDRCMPGNGLDLDQLRADR